MLTGFRRPNGRVGIRNHVVVLPADDLSNAVAENVANAVPGTIALSHAYGRMQFGDDLAVTLQTLIGTASNPNVAAAIVIGVEEPLLERILEGIRKSGIPARGYCIADRGDIDTAANATRGLAEFAQDASEVRREPIDVSELMLSLKCGESDPTSGLAACPTVGGYVDRHIAAGGTAMFGETSELTGAEHLIAERCETSEVGAAFWKTYRDCVDAIEAGGHDLLGSQPTWGNIRGGISTIEEKALGNVAKTGSAAIVDVLQPAQAPTRAGLQFMHTNSAAADLATAMAAAGAVLQLFPTGKCNIVGHPVMPTIKITANRETVTAMADHVDLDVADLLDGDLDMTGAVERLSDFIERTVNGRLTRAEVLGHRELAITRQHLST